MNIKPFTKLKNYLLTHDVPAEVMRRAYEENHFFTPENIERAVHAIAHDLIPTETPVIVSKYRRCAIIMAGNIPLVGFVDMMCCVMTGCDTYVKPSSKDRPLMEWIVGKLCEFGASNLFYWNNDIEVDAVIATGSNNANRYFDLRFGELPALKRGSRSSVAVIDGTETSAEIDALWGDMFDYFGLGCRSVSHLFIIEGYDPTPLFERLSQRKLKSRHYLNAYRQIRALKIMNNEEFFDGHFFVACKGANLTPSIGEITYSYFTSEVIDNNRDKLQCVIGHNFTKFGESQHPKLEDWADGVNVFEFLTRQNY